MIIIGTLINWLKTTENISVLSYIVIGVISGIIGGIFSVAILNLIKVIFKKPLISIKNYWFNFKYNCVYAFDVLIKKRYKEEYLEKIFEKVHKTKNVDKLSLIDKKLLRENEHFNMYGNEEELEEQSFSIKNTIPLEVDNYLKNIDTSELLENLKNKN